MELLDYDILLLWISFAFCLALTAGGILVIFRIEQKGRTITFRYLQYSMVSLYVFGFYSLWSTILLSRFLDIENVHALTAIISQMGLPFFGVSLVMQLRWAISTQYEFSKFVVPVSLSVGVTIAVMFLLLEWPAVDRVRGTFSLAAFIVSVVVVAIFIGGKTAVLQREWVNRIVALVAAAGLIHLTLFTRLVQHEYYESIFVFLFFLFYTAIALLFAYTAKFEQSDRSFDAFVLSYNITKREVDIIQGIYDGKTNQEIADRLFITLQTVKDHSSRIYQKTRVKNRAQLAALLRDSQSIRTENGPIEQN